MIVVVHEPSFCWDVRSAAGAHICFELGAESSFPVPEATSSGYQGRLTIIITNI